MSSRFGATFEQIKTDRAHPEGSKDLLGLAATGVAKGYDVISGIAPSILGIFSAQEYQTLPRDGITAQTRAAIHNTLTAKWVKSGPMRIINIVPKAITAILELPDGVIRDGLQVVGGGKPTDGTIVKSVA